LPEGSRILPKPSRPKCIHLQGTQMFFRPAARASREQWRACKRLGLKRDVRFGSHHHFSSGFPASSFGLGKATVLPEVRLLGETHRTRQRKGHSGL
jgi:hypothetical protein